MILVRRRELNDVTGLLIHKSGQVLGDNTPPPPPIGIPWTKLTSWFTVKSGSNLRIEFDPSGHPSDLDYLFSLVAGDKLSGHPVVWGDQHYVSSRPCTATCRVDGKRHVGHAKPNPG
jgi:hypothetical protein